MKQTFIPGKDAALESSIAKMQQKLLTLGFDIEEASWLNPVPYVWSVHIRDKDCPLCFTNGKGASKKAALASALGEYFERLSCNYFFADFYLGEKYASSSFVHYPDEQWFAVSENQLPDQLMDQRMKDFYDAEGELRAEHLIDCNSGNKERGICALRYQRQSDGKDVFVPVAVIGNLYVSNGMSAGNTVTEARVQSLSEIFERAIKNRIISEAISLPEIPLEVLQRYPTIMESIETLEKEGFKIYCFDASLGGQFPVISVVLLNRDNGTAYASFGGHPRFEVALERTVTELLQGRSLKDLDVFTPPTFDTESVAEHHNLETHFIDSSGLLSWDLFKATPDYEFVDWNFAGTTEEEYQHLMAIFNALDKEVYISDYEHLGVYACRIIVPDFSEIYPPEELVWNNNNSGNNIREVLLQLPGKGSDNDFLNQIMSDLDALDIDESASVAEFIGIAPENGNPWQTLRFAELRALIALALGDLESALDGILWTLDFAESTFPQERIKFYRALSNLLEVAIKEPVLIKEYQQAFENMYGEQAVSEALSHLNGEKHFAGLNSSSLELENFPLHQKLLSAYEKLQRAKR